MFFTLKGSSAPAREITPAAARELTVAQRENRDAVFHGVCRNCLSQKGNNSGAGMEWCLGCTYSCWTDSLSNRYLPKFNEPEGS